jgi:hypothetical protein
MEIKTR